MEMEGWRWSHMESHGEDGADARWKWWKGWVGGGEAILTPSPSPQWDLVCGYRQLRQMAQSVYMAGVLVGALVLGGLSDK